MHDIYTRNPKLRKADVYVITENINTSREVGRIKYQNRLTAAQQKLYDQFGVKGDIRASFKKNNFPEHFEFDPKKEGLFLGTEWESGFDKVASVDLVTSIKINFQVSSDHPVNSKQAADQLAPIARVLQLLPSSQVTLTGNAGTELNNPTNELLGNAPAALNRPAILNGQQTTTANVMFSRAKSAGRILVGDYKIDNNRVKIDIGSVFGKPGGRKGDVKIINTNL